MKNILILTIFVVITSLLVAGCGGGGSSAPVGNNISISIAPTNLHLNIGETFSGLMATVSGTTDSRVTWAASKGTITPQGVYTAPSTTGTYTVTATSVADPTKSSSVSLVVENVILPPPPPDNP